MGAGGAVRGICQVREISGQPSWYRGLGCCKGKAELGLQVEEVGRGLPAGGQYFQTCLPGSLWEQRKANPQDLGTQLRMDHCPQENAFNSIL